MLDERKEAGKQWKSKRAKNGGFRETFLDALSPLSGSPEQAIVCCNKPFLFEGEKTFVNVIINFSADYFGIKLVMKTTVLPYLDDRLFSVFVDLVRGKDGLVKDK